MKQIKLKKFVRLGILPVLMAIVMAGCSHLNTNDAESVQRITKEELKARLDNPDTMIIDVRSKRDWEKSDAKIPGAIRQSPSTEDMSWAARYPRDKSIVLYCA